MNQVPMKNGAIKCPHHSIKWCMKDIIRKPGELVHSNVGTETLHVLPTQSQEEKESSVPMSLPIEVN